MNQRYEKSVQYVGIDLHRRRSVVVRMDGEGVVVDCVRIDNSVEGLVGEVAKAGPGAEVAVEATYGSPEPIEPPHGQSHRAGKKNDEKPATGKRRSMRPPRAEEPARTDAVPRRPAHRAQRRLLRHPSRP